MFKKTEYPDFVYVMQDPGTIYLGCKFSYQMLIEDDRVNFKLKTIIRRYLLEKVSPDTTLESHLFFLQAQDPAAQVYEQLKAKVSCSVYGDSDKGSAFKERVFKVQELYAIPPEEKEKMGMVIRELSISKLALFGFMV